MFFFLLHTHESISPRGCENHGSSNSVMYSDIDSDLSCLLSFLFL